VAEGAKLFRPVGCPECKDIGYKAASACTSCWC